MIARLMTAVVAVGGCCAALLAAEPKLENAREVFPNSPSTRMAEVPSLLRTMHVSPDGSGLLFLRLAAEDDAGKGQGTGHALIYQNLASGQRIMVPPDRAKYEAAELLLRFNFFDAAGKQLILPDRISRTDASDPNIQKTGGMQWRLLDVEQGTLEDFRLETFNQTMVKLTPDGKSVVVSGRMPAIGQKEITGRVLQMQSDQGLVEFFSPDPMGMRAVIQRIDGSEPERQLFAPGMVYSISPTAGTDENPWLGACYVPPPDNAATMPSDRSAKARDRLVVWDLTHDDYVADLPVHPRNSMLDDFETQWTQDGRYLYYDDYENAFDDAATRGPLRNVTRAWDVQGKKLAWTIDESRPIGCGPGSWMVLTPEIRGNRTPKGIILHNGQKGEHYTIGQKTMTLIHAAGGKIVYTQEAEDGGARKIMIADLVEEK